MAAEILVVDDEADIRTLVCGLLEDDGFEAREAANSADALSEISRRRPSLVMLDIWLQGSDMDGLGILKWIKSNHEDLPVIMMSGHGTVETAVAAIRDGAYDFVEKPFQTDRLFLAINRALDTARLKRENTELRQKAGGEEEIIGASNAMRELRSAIERVAPTNSRVLIAGPPGSGKELIARQVHRHSSRAGAPLVTLNCATLAPDRMEAELFGTEGLGDSDGKIGLLEQAHGGTLLLDEVADMPLETQGKIVRVLQEQVFVRIGGSSPVEVDVRVIATTSRNLNDAIEAGHFREDLYYRLNVVPLQAPSLREHREDIETIAAHFMDRAASNAGRPARAIAEDALAALHAHAWPGNVRELRNVVERMLIMAPGDEDQPIGYAMLPAEIRGEDSGGTGNVSTATIGLSLREAREHFERDYLAAQLERFDGNISKTASFIGMERSALHRKLKSLGLTS